MPDAFDTSGPETDTTSADDESPPCAVVLASGGMDSTTAAYEALERGYELFVLHTSYGQRTASKEYECARALADAVDAVEFVHVETDHLAAIGGSSLTDDGPIEDAATDREEIPSTYVPFRNANLLAMAVSYAEATSCEAVFVGAHSEDYAGYPDCRPAFFEAFQRVVDVGTKPETEISIEVPFVDCSKTEIAARGIDLGVPFERTWSCYRDEEPACGTCDSCAYRLGAFQALGERDPIPYAERPRFD